MIRRLSPTALALLAAGALLAGCGSSSSSSSGGSSSSTASTSSSSSTASTASAPAAKSPKVAAAVAQCKQGVKVLPTLPQATKSRLESICDKAASNDPKAVRTASREACEEIVKASPLPAGTARDRALSGCKSAGAK
jgi:ABC-type glycerol-3-phosphate transport system substrate-binding protein